jgi:CubicO group peptidase (beta-lactamase class C family)
MPPGRASLERSIDAWAERVRRRGKIPGMSLGIVHHGRRIVAKGYGYRDREEKLPATPATVYGVASITKSFTALAILRLEEEGRLRVDDPVVRHLPEFGTPEPRWTRKITLHHFLTHSSGLPPLPSIYYASARSLALEPPYDRRVAKRVGIDPDHAPIDTYEGMLEFLRTEPYRLLGPPGAQFSYSNEAFGLLGAVIERVTGRTYESYLEEAILRPAGMRHSTFDTGIMYRFPEVTALYSPRWNDPKHRLVRYDQWWEDTCLRACGALRTNVDDMFAYLGIFLSGGRAGSERIVSRRSIGRMLTPHVPIVPGLDYGYGISVRPDHHGVLVGLHTGGLKGVSAEFTVVPKKQLGGVVLSNAEQVPAPVALDGAINLVLGLPEKTPFYDPLVRGPRPRSVAEYAGWYCSGEGIWARVTARRDALRVDFRGIEEVRQGIVARPYGPDLFVVRDAGQVSALRFRRDRRGRIDRAVIGWRIVRRRRPSELRLAREHRMVW